MDVGQKGLAHYHGDVFIGRGVGLCEGEFRVGDMRLWQHCLYGWVSCVRAGGGWVAGWLPEKLVGMWGQSRGRMPLGSLLTEKKDQSLFSLCTGKDPAKLLQMQSCSWWLSSVLRKQVAFWVLVFAVHRVYAWVSGLAGKENGQQLIKTGDAPPPLFPTRYLKPLSRHPLLPPPPLPSSTYRGLVLVSVYFQLSFILSCPLLLLDWQ